MASIIFTDTIGKARLYNAKPFPGDRFANWTPESEPVGSAASRLSDGAVSMFRFRSDYSVSFELPGIPSKRSTNLLLRSEELDNASWTKSNATISADAAGTWDGSSVADKIQEDNATAGHAVSQSISGTSNGDIVTYSHFLKAAERSWALLQILGRDGAFHTQYVNLSTGVLGTGSSIVASAIESWGRSWYRAWVAANLGSGATTPVAYTYVSTGDGVSSYLGTTGSGIYGAGAQCELASTPTAYVLTTTAAVSSLSLSHIADRLRYHLLNGGTCAVYANDAPNSFWSNCGLKPGTRPEVRLTDRRTIEFTMQLQLLDLSAGGSMQIRYADQ